jgi:hypothetical protein
MLESARTRYLDMYGPSMALMTSKKLAIQELDELQLVLGF